VLELVGGFDHHESRAGDQIVGLEKSIDEGFRDKISRRIREPDREFAG
jgi:hypothetical protein